MVKPVLGITGGVASGKSTVTGMFAALGACPISADEIARDLLAPGSPVTSAVIARFGPGITIDNAAAEIDRAKLARLIFADDAARRALGDLTHPLIRERMRAQIAAGLADADVPLVAAEVPLLYENGLESTVTHVLVARCPEAVQVARLMARRPLLSEDEALRQVRSQIPLDEKARRADFVVNTDQPLGIVEDEVARIFAQLTRVERDEK